MDEGGFVNLFRYRAEDGAEMAFHETAANTRRQLEKGSSVSAQRCAIPIGGGLPPCGVVGEIFVGILDKMRPFPGG